MRTIATIEGHDIIEQDDLSVTFTAKAAIDGDGSGASHGDPDFQPRTSLRLNGVSLNSDIVPYIVVPPAIIQGVKPIVLGSRAVVGFGRRTVEAVVGDVGPHAKLGEISIACAEALGIPSSPNTGGVDSGVEYTIYPGTPALANGVQYQLQPS